MSKRSLFVIEGDKISIGKARFHKDLVENKANVRGGGQFVFNSETNTFTLFGKSHDFGPARSEEVQRLVDLGEVYNYGKRNIGKRYKFKVG
jgi:hypothetical protein